MIGIAEFNSAIGGVKNHTEIRGHNCGFGIQIILTPDLAFNSAGGEYRCSYLSIESQICNSPGNKKGNTANATSLNCIFLRYRINQSGHHSVNRCWRKVQLSDCLALRCRRLISPCSAVTINCAVLSPDSLFSSIASTIWCGTRTSILFDFAFTDFVAITGFHCSRCPTIIYELNYNSKLDVSHTLIIGCVRHLEVLEVTNDEALRCCSTLRASDHNVNRGNSMAMHKSTQTHPEFTWRFAECQENKATYHTATAHTENEARSQLPDLRLVFTAKIRREVNHV